MTNYKIFIFAVIFAFAKGSSLADTYVLGTLSNDAPPEYKHNTFVATTTMAVREEKECENFFCSKSSINIENDGRTLFKYWNLEVIDRYDYINSHYWIIYASSGKDDKPELEIVSDSGKKWKYEDFRTREYGKESANTISLAEGITPNGELLNVTDKKIIFQDLATNQIKQTLMLPVPFVAAHVGTDNFSSWAIIGIDADYSVWMGDGIHWTHSAPGIVNVHHDIKDSLSVYPKDNGEWVGAVHVQFNIYNKGVMLIYGKSESPAKHAWAINSDDKNYGLHPAVQWKNDIVMLGGLNRSDNKSFSLSIPQQVVRSMNYEMPPHTKDFQTENVTQADNNLSVMLGGSLAVLRWNAASNTTLSSVNYDIANTLYKGINIEGRYGNRNLAVSYMQNQAEDMAQQSGGTIAKEASSRLYGYFDFDSKVNAEDSLRITFERAVLRGVATYSDVNNSLQQAVFNNEYAGVGLLSIGKDGDYFKGEYSQSKLPMAVGFRSGNAGAATVSIFEPEAQFQEFRFGVGHDEMAYAYKNETNYMNWYLNGEFTVGIGIMKVRDATLQSAIAAGADAPSNSTLATGIHAGGEVGYMFQQRSKSLRGFGQSFSAGLRLKGDYVSRVDGNWNWSYIEFNRYDVLYGPFLRYNLIF